MPTTVLPARPRGASALLGAQGRRVAMQAAYWALAMAVGGVLVAIGFVLGSLTRRSAIERAPACTSCGAAVRSPPLADALGAPGRVSGEAGPLGRPPMVEPSSQRARPERSATEPVAAAGRAPALKAEPRENRRSDEPTARPIESASPAAPPRSYVSPVQNPGF